MRKNESGKIKKYFPSATNQRYVDGSVASDLPMKRLSELFNVNTFIVSQVNPHVCPFVSVDTGAILDTKLRKRFTKMLKALTGNHLDYWIN
jgi:TAG lipase / steryl ester hydrolase / phospholipase A2 / LPA acyltransferase